jgi:hypothetical protein
MTSFKVVAGEAKNVAIVPQGTVLEVLETRAGSSRMKYWVTIQEDWQRGFGISSPVRGPQAKFIVGNSSM